MPDIDYVLVLILLAGALFGTKLGADMQKKVSGKSIRKYFAVIVMAAALIVIGKLLKLFQLCGSTIIIIVLS
jgi:uncharacterized membrane protein YfcA